MTPRLSSSQIESARLNFPHWRFDTEGVAIERTFKFTDFGVAFAFMTKLALYAERHNHHPEWQNVYNRVGIRLTTHDAQGLTEKDLHFAQAADKLYQLFREQPDA